MYQVIKIAKNKIKLVSKKLIMLVQVINILLMKLHDQKAPKDTGFQQKQLKSLPLHSPLCEQVAGSSAPQKILWAATQEVSMYWLSMLKPNMHQYCNRPIQIYAPSEIGRVQQVEHSRTSIKKHVRF
jgi:hypothetical protein